MQFKYFLGAVLAVVPAIAREVDTTGIGNLTAVLASNEELSGLVALLSSSPELLGSLSNTENITVLAPSNTALDALNNSGILSSSGQGALIEALLSYHVLVGVLDSSSFTEIPAFPTTLLNTTAYTNATEGQVVECRRKADDVTVVSGYKNNVTVIDAVSTPITTAVIRLLTVKKTLPSTTE